MKRGWHCVLSLCGAALLCLDTFAPRAYALSPAVESTPGADAEARFGDTAVLRQALALELQRGLAKLRLSDMPPPYYAAASVLDEAGVTADATLGALRQCHPFRGRTLSVEVRVGGYDLDDSNFLGGEPPSSPTRIGWEADSQSIRYAVWLAMDAEYKRATATYEAKRAARQTRSTTEAMPSSFARVVPVRSIDDAPAPILRELQLAQLARALSGVAREATFVQESGALVSAIRSRRTLVTTEGAELVDVRALTVAVAWAAVQAPDGMWVRRHVMYWAETPESLPPLNRMSDGVRDIIGELEALRAAPLVENYTGPVVFAGRAAAQLVEHLLATQLSGTPNPEMPLSFGATGPTLLSRLGLRVLPSGFTVVDDPTLTHWAGEPLMGHYRFDDEGVRAERLELVHRGRLTALPMSRTPSRDLGSPNGHGRRGYGATAVGSASNLIVDTDSRLTREQLRQILLDAARDEDLPAAIIIRELEDPFVTLFGGVQSRTASLVRPGTLPAALMAYRIHADGTEELVRGATFDSIDLRTLRSIEAPSRNHTLYHSTAFAVRAATESGSLAPPGLSIVVPDLLLREVDVLADQSPQPRLPTLGRP